MERFYIERVKNGFMFVVQTMENNVPGPGEVFVFNTTEGLAEHLLDRFGRAEVKKPRRGRKPGRKPKSEASAPAPALVETEAAPAAEATPEKDEAKILKALLRKRNLPIPRGRVNLETLKKMVEESEKSAPKSAPVPVSKEEEDDEETVVVDDEEEVSVDDFEPEEEVAAPAKRVS